MFYPKYIRNMHNGIAPNASTAKDTRSETASADSFYERLAAEIVICALADWRDLVKKRAWEGEQHPQCNFAELRIFFQSQWCEQLTQNFEIEPARMLELLEKELEEAKRKESIEQSKKIKGAKA